MFFFQAEDGIRDLVRSRGLGDVYKRQDLSHLGATVLLLFVHRLKQTAHGLLDVIEDVVDLSLIHI